MLGWRQAVVLMQVKSGKGAEDNFRRRFLKDYGPSLPAVAFFCTMGDSGAASTFEDMQARLGKPPRASCSFDAKALNNGSYLGALDHFAMQLAGDAHSPPSRQPAPDGIPMHP